MAGLDPAIQLAGRSGVHHFGVGVLLSVSQIDKRFPSPHTDGGTEALRDLSFTVAPGEFVSLLGPSGCGKSTALRLIAGLLPPDSGAVTWPAGKPPIGFVFQDATLMPWADARANVRLPLDLQHIPRAEGNARAEAALARVGLAGFARAVPRELSGGMKMRVSIARALVTEPSLLLLDEPFAALDEPTRAALNDDLLRLWKEAPARHTPGRQKLTVIFVTHSVGESAYLSSRVLVMTRRPGRVAADIALPPGPRTRLSPQFLEIERRIAAALPKAAA
jgi:NitT/TauT family transport system ATP-binding protein